MTRAFLFLAPAVVGLLVGLARRPAPVAPVPVVSLDAPVVVSSDAPTPPIVPCGGAVADVKSLVEAKPTVTKRARKPVVVAVKKDTDELPSTSERVSLNDELGVPASRD